MGYSMKDLENAGRNINEHFERKAQERGEELANRVIHSSAQGRGLWVFILWPAWLMIFAFSGIFLKVAIKNLFSVSEPLSWIGLLGGFAFAVSWYKWNYTIRHPFLGSMVGYFCTVFGVLFLAAKLGW